MANQLLTIGTARHGTTRISTANTARDGSGTCSDLLTAGSAGARVDSITGIATGGTTAGMLRFYTYDGSNYRLRFEMQVGAMTPSASDPVWIGNVNSAQYPELMPVYLKASEVLKVSTHNAEQFDVHADGGDF